jgi:hypothetical protein
VSRVSTREHLAGPSRVFLPLLLMALVCSGSDRLDIIASSSAWPPRSELPVLLKVTLKTD